MFYLVNKLSPNVKSTSFTTNVKIHPTCLNQNGIKTRTNRNFVASPCINDYYPNVSLKSLVDKLWVIYCSNKADKSWGGIWSIVHTFSSTIDCSLKSHMSSFMFQNDTMATVDQEFKVMSSVIKKWERPPLLRLFKIWNSVQLTSQPPLKTSQCILTPISRFLLPIPRGILTMTN